MVRIYSLISGVIFLFLSSFVHSQTYGSLEAVKDTMTIGPMQSVRINVIANDTMPCIDNYSWRILTTLDPTLEGTVVKEGDYIIFRPSLACRETTVSIQYAIKCSNIESTATVEIEVTKYNQPINVLPNDLECVEGFPANVGFDVEDKFHSNAVTPTHSHRIIVYSMPLVGDLNGDRKPEILAIGLASTFVQTTASARYIIIMDGQTGETLVEKDMGFDFVVASDNPDASAYHSSPSYMAIADVDNDGKGEIIIAFPIERITSNTPYKYSERVVAFNVKTDNVTNTITDLEERWIAADRYKVPLTGTNHLVYDVPAPYIADLNGDGIPEVIVYNKIYNAQTGKLLMAWDGPADPADPDSGKSSIASGTGLYSYENPAIYTSETTSNNVYNRAFVGRRPSTSTEVWKDDYIAVFAVENMDDDEDLEVIAGNRIYKFHFDYLGKDGDTRDHTANKYTTIEGPRSVRIPTTGSDSVTYYLSDGFTRVVDIDGDGHLDVINISEIATTGGYGSRAGGLITVWDPRSPDVIKAASVFHGNGGVVEHIPTFGIPFVGDINGKVDGGWDGTQFTKKLPEIGLLTGNLYINASNSAPRRNGITFHPLSDDILRQDVGWNNNDVSTTTRRFNRSVTNGQGHIFAVTYCDSAGIVPFHRRLKLCWAMEHNDRSANTGLTIFDFNNDGANDLIYRDEKTLRVISPAYNKGGNTGKDYVTVGENGTEANTSVMFWTPAFSFTGYEAAIVADVNMDASADIVVTNAPNSGDHLDGWISVFQYESGTTKWAPAPPVWNQAYYNLRHIREDLTVPTRPIPMLTEYQKDGETIRPYNGAWEQQTYVMDGTDYIPVVRQPDAELVNMVVNASTPTSTEVTLTIRNRGAASITANTPIAFYDGGGNPGSPLEQSTIINTLTVGIDIFPGESVSHSFILSSFDGNGKLIWAHIMDNDRTFPAAGFQDCDLTNNTASGAYCQNMNYSITPPGDITEICEKELLTLTATPGSTPQYAATYQWFRDESLITGATNQTYTTSVPGSYTCYVTEGICRQYTDPKTVIVRPMEPQNDYVVAIKGIPAIIHVLTNDTLLSICQPEVLIESKPAHGTAGVSGDSILYTPNDGYTGTDEIVYSLTEGGETAIVYIQVVEAPDNISDATCTVNAQAGDWTIREIPINIRDTIDNYGPLTVGDIDGDGSVEVFAYAPHLPAGESTGAIHKRSGLKVFRYGASGQMELKSTIPFLKENGEEFKSSAMGAPAIARHDGRGYIVVLNNDDFHLYAFDENGGYRWRSDEEATESKHATMIGITDFNGDGIPEVYTGNKIFSLEDGTLLCDGGAANNKGILLENEGYSSMAVDMDGDGLPELCAGTQIYKVNIPDSTIQVIEDMQLDDALLPSINVDRDGATQVADIDNDGQLEVVVISLKNTYVTVYVWKPLPNDQSYLIGSYTVPGIDTYYSIPMIGNIDETPSLEIVFIADVNPYEIRALEYKPENAPGSQIAEKWYFGESDASGCTGMSLFDFNLDGIAEIVYRDETTLRIIDGNVQTGGTPDVLSTFNNVTSWTLREMPVIADIDGDGQAEIIVSGGCGTEAGAGAANEKYNGYLRVFKSGDIPWAPARKVWNQYAYNAININEDLTVPRYQINPTTSFPGANGAFGDGNDVRPYNAFLQQQTILSHLGVPLRLAPFGEIVESSVVRHYAENDSLSITLVITNSGVAGFQPPLYITAYKDFSQSGNEIVTDSIMSLVNPGDTITFAMPIRNFSSHLPLSSIVVLLNDKGSATLVQAECTSEAYNGVFRSSGLLIANNDTVALFANHSVEVDILTNDTIPVSYTSFAPEITGAPKHGDATLVNDTIRYTPYPDYTGPDTVIYRLACDGDTATALVRIIVNSIPDNMDDSDCRYTTSPGKIGALKLEKVSNAEVYWLATPFVGDLDGDDLPEVVVPGKETGDTHGYAPSILIFNDTLNLKNTITPPSPLKIPAYNTMALLIADVVDNDDGLSEIVFCTTDKKVRCYSHEGMQLWESNSTYSSEVDTCVSLIVADINGDGYAEILASDKIFAGESGQELLTLPAGGRGFSNGSPASYMPVFADVDNDGIQEVVAGNTVYKVTITNRNGTNGNTATVLAQAPAGLPDGFTAVADIDLDGDPDVIVTGGNSNNSAVMYVWDGATSAQIGNTISVTSNGGSISRASVGNITGADRPEIVFTYVNALEAYRYDPTGSGSFVRFIQKPVDDPSGATVISLFDLDLNGEAELIYRDQSKLYIMDKDGNFKSEIACGSATHTEYPVIVDLNRDGHADILVSGNTAPDASGVIRIVRYGSDSDGNWAPARPVWNQHGYNSIHINDDLSVPKFPPNPASVFPGADGLLNTGDEVRPYNNFLQQQTPLDFDGIVYWPQPDVVLLESESKIEFHNNILNVYTAVYNQGSGVMDIPIYVTFYNETTGSRIATKKFNDKPLGSGDMGYATFAIGGLSTPPVKIIARVNENNGVFPVVQECKDDNNELFLTNMKKEASINGVSNNGMYGNPVSVLHGEDILYKITAFNMNAYTGTVIIEDTLPAYLNYFNGSADPSVTRTQTSGTPPRDILKWELTNITSGKDTTVAYLATPAPGVCASQPLFVNGAWVTSVIPNNMIVVQTNSTYHQGAGVSTLLFSAGYGGSIYNAEPQVLDYKTSARAGVLTVPDEGYAFTGWSHDDYYSLRGERIPAQSDIIHYDTLLIFGDVELTADFKLIDYPIRYYLNGGENAGNNPQAYTIRSGDITLEEPSKAGDVFVGWTGSNGTEPQKTVTILEGTTGELKFYANYLYSDHEEEIRTEEISDKIWGAENELFIRRAKTGSIVKIYSPNGMLTSLHTILSAGTTKIKLPRGIYMVTLNNGAAQKVIIK